MTSLLEPNPDVLNLFHGFPSWGEVIETVSLQTVRLDDVPETAGADFIKIDIQGGELMALTNAVDRLRDVVVIQTEVEFVKMYKNQPLFSEVEIFLRSQGFIFHRFFSVETRPLQPMAIAGSEHTGISQNLFADAIFIRDFTKIVDFSNHQILAAAAIIHNFYWSIDLCFKLLLEYDRRTEGEIAARYFKAIQGADVNSNSPSGD